MDLLKIFENRGNHASQEVAEWVVDDQRLLNQLFEGVVSRNKKIKNAAIKTLRIISLAEPHLIYPKFYFFLDLFTQKDQILKWSSIDIIGNLSSVDIQDRIDSKVVGYFIDLFFNEIMITAAHSIDNIWKIAIHKPQFTNRIVSDLIKLDRKIQNDECRNILLGKVILALGQIMPQIENREPIIDFATQQIKNPRPATRLKAEKFLDRYQKIRVSGQN